MQPPKKELDKKEPDKKDPDKKEPTKPPEIKWPTDINGKGLEATVKDLVEDHDPTVREMAARTLPAFGPPAQMTAVSKKLVKRMTEEKDPGVRIAVFTAVGQIQFENVADNKEAVRILALTVDTGAPGGLSRLHAIQTITQFGPKGEGAITSLTGVALNDPAYETRRTIANALGRIGFNETTGPNMKALTALADKLAKDDSAAVRMEAMQSLMLLGPPWDGLMKAGAKAPPPINAKLAEVIVGHMKVRVGDPKKKTLGMEKDKQVEIWARLVLMRFDPKEVNDDNLDAISKYLTGADLAVKIQALQAMTVLGENGSKKLPDVIRILEDKTAPLTLTVVSVQVLMSMGTGAKPALPNLRKMMGEKKKELDAKKIELAKKKDDLQLISDAVALDELVKLLEAAIKHIDEAKQVSPSVATPPEKKP